MKRSIELNCLMADRIVTGKRALKEQKEKKAGVDKPRRFDEKYGGFE